MPLAVQLIALDAFQYFKDLNAVGIRKAGQQWPEQGSVVVHGAAPDDLKRHRGARCWTPTGAEDS
jgi:hypothetical protein